MLRNLSLLELEKRRAKSEPLWLYSFGAMLLAGFIIVVWGILRFTDLVSPYFWINIFVLTLCAFIVPVLITTYRFFNRVWEGALREFFSRVYEKYGKDPHFSELRIHELRRMDFHKLKPFPELMDEYGRMLDEIKKEVLTREEEERRKPHRIIDEQLQKLFVNLPGDSKHGRRLRRAIGNYAMNLGDKQKLLAEVTTTLSAVPKVPAKIEQAPKPSKFDRRLAEYYAEVGEQAVPQEAEQLIQQALATKNPSLVAQALGEFRREKRRKEELSKKAKSLTADPSN